ncbi:hypothetical protein [Aquabacterium sp.]|uniref:hypothetical protein n=1 Tax=Aquabacterium sp. TaxID=1872578 RepID=UPI002616368A|nr:hypothetical protein [Aquabacterium sp.]MDD2976136.1 hypothetical protein [Aquabacterium sp.]
MNTSSEALASVQARWDELFSRIDQVFITGSVSQWTPTERTRFLADIKEPCHLQIWNLGLTTYKPIAAMTADDLIDCD